MPQIERLLEQHLEGEPLTLSRQTESAAVP